MSVRLLHGRSIRFAIAAAAAVLVTALVSSSALAAHRPPQRLTIVRPYNARVRGTIFLSVRGIQRGAVSVVFSVDGRKVWSVGRLSARLRRPTAINTQKLRNGRHVLSLRVTYANHRTVTARKVIVVQNAHPTATGQAHSASAGGSTVKTVAPPPPPGVVQVAAPPAGGVQGAPVALFNRETYQYQTSLPTSVEANRYQFMVLSGNEYAEIPLLKAFNPNLKFLVYQAIMFTKSTDFSWMQTVTGCTPYSDDAANHPSWILHDQNGNPVIAPNQTALYATDVGNPDYQRACAANAVALAKQYGFDGVFFDVVEGNLGYTLRPGVTVPEYPNNTVWQAAMTSALAYIGPAVRAQGLLAFGNIGVTANVSQWEQWVGFLDGAEEEAWIDEGRGLVDWAPLWPARFAELNWAAANGKYELLHADNTGEAPNTFGLAAMLLAANGRASYSATSGATTDEYWFPEYDTALQLGAPAGPYTVLANGVYERVFAHGIVLVNPTLTSVPIFSLGGGSYSGSGLTNARSVQLGPTSGLILLKTG
jgi:hypothetical protein